MTLYEMTEQARALYELLQEGEIDEQTLADTLESIGADEKLETYCKLILQYEADMETIKIERDRLLDKRKTAENAVERLKNGIMEFMTAQNITKSDMGLFKVYIGESKAVDVINENAIPRQFRTPQPDKIDKAEIRRRLMGGEHIAGCELKITKGVRIK